MVDYAVLYWTKLGNEDYSAPRILVHPPEWLEKIQCRRSPSIYPNFTLHISPMIVTTSSRYFGHDSHVQPIIQGEKKTQALFLCVTFFDLTLQPQELPIVDPSPVTHRKTSRTLTWPSHHERRTNSILFGSGRQKLTDFLGQSSGHSLWSERCGFAQKRCSGVNRESLRCHWFWLKCEARHSPCGIPKLCRVRIGICYHL